jgi:hypothetical protein
LSISKGVPSILAIVGSILSYRKDKGMGSGCG